MRKIAFFFWLHFVFASIVHVVTPIMLIGLVTTLINSELGFFTSGLILGCSIFSLQFIINHLTNPNSFCVLNDLENYYRDEIGLPRVGAFLPRFYTTWNNLVKLKFKIPN